MIALSDLPYQYQPPTASEASTYCSSKLKTANVNYMPDALTPWEKTSFEANHGKPIYISRQSIAAAFIEASKLRIQGSYSIGNNFLSFAGARLWIDRQFLEIFNIGQHDPGPSLPAHKTIALNTWKTTYTCEKTRRGNLLLTKESESRLGSDPAITTGEPMVVVVTQSAFRAS